MILACARPWVSFLSPIKEIGGRGKGEGKKRRKKRKDQEEEKGGMGRRRSGEEGGGKREEWGGGWGEKGERR